MGRSRSRSPPRRERARSRSRERDVVPRDVPRDRDLDRERNRLPRERHRSRSRSLSPRLRNRSPPRRRPRSRNDFQPWDSPPSHVPSCLSWLTMESMFDTSPRRRSRSPRRRSRSRERKDKVETPAALPKFLLERPPITAKDLEGKTEEEKEMMKLMGFGSFDSSKGKHIAGNNVGAVHVIHKRKYRQYMNRKGGFNRPLDYVA
ncbi:uncharacterized protein LOC144164312 isoform X1 [Haemaphysalis longicornis]